MSDLKTETVLVTPELASKFLATQIKNRPVTTANLDHYSRMMKEGKWELNGEAIKFNTEGNLIDGQHRLRAVIRSGKSVSMLVVNGLNGRAFETLDTGKTRSGADLLALEGYSQTSPLSAAARSLFSYQAGVWAGKSYGLGYVSPLEIVDIIRANPDLVTAVAALKGVYREFGRLWSPGYGAFLLCVARRQSPIKADQFFNEVSTGKVDSLDAITWVLRERLMTSAASPAQRLQPQTKSAFCVKAWIAYRDDRIVERLRFAKNEEFPKL